MVPSLSMCSGGVSSIGGPGSSGSNMVFDAHTGVLQPHFAYGALDKPSYTRAHLMHLANHWQAFVPAA